MGTCPACGKLVAIQPAPRDAFGRPRKRVVDHDVAERRCAGSRALL
jgi:hypothetical protein